MPGRRRRLRRRREGLRLLCDLRIPHPDEARRLEIRGRGRPARGLEHLAHVALGDRAVAKLADRTARADKGAQVTHGSMITLSAPSTRSLNVRSASAKSLSGKWCVMRRAAGIRPSAMSGMTSSMVLRFARTP